MSTPKVGDLETNTCDFKVRYPSDHTRSSKMVSDVVALANANGGNLFVGVADKDDRAVAIPGLTREEAKQTRTDLERAIKDLVQPIPVFNITELPTETDSEKLVLAVSVQAYPGTAVGFRVAGGTEGPWSFPVRVGTQTKLYPPERLSLLMDVQLRRKIQLLHLAMQSGQVDVESTLSPRESMRSQDNARVYVAELVSIDEVGASVEFRLPDGNVCVALRFVRDAWRDGDRWRVWLAGGLFERRGTKAWFESVDLRD